MEHPAVLDPTLRRSSQLLKEQQLGVLRRSTASGRLIRNREAVGRLRVRCVSASQLLPAVPADVRALLRPWSKSPYMLVYLQDLHNNQQSVQRRTRAIARTGNPQWREEFWFAVRKTPESLVLRVEVYDQNSPREDSCLGCSCVQLDHDFLEEAQRKRQSCELELGPLPGKGQTPVSGTVKIEVGWEPSLVLNSAASARAIAWIMLRSPQVLRVLSVVMLGIACLFLLVARGSRWLCSGHSLSQCRAVDVPGADTCALLSALGAFVACSVHFTGSAGLFGSGWDDRPPTLVEFAEADIDEEEDGAENGMSTSTASVQLQMQSVGTFPAALRWNVMFNTNLFPKISLVAVRVFAWLAHLASLSLAVLALALAKINDDTSTFLAEAVWLDILAVLALLAGGAVFWHEGRLLREQADRWKLASECSFKADPRVCMDGTGGSHEAFSPTLIEELAHRAQRRLNMQVEQVQRLQDDLRGRFDELSLAQPLLEAGQRIQEQFDALQHLQESAAAQHRWMQPLLGVGTLSAPPTPDLREPTSTGTDLAVEVPTAFSFCCQQERRCWRPPSSLCSC